MAGRRRQLEEDAAIERAAERRGTKQRAVLAERYAIARQVTPERTRIEYHQFREGSICGRLGSQLEHGAGAARAALRGAAVHVAATVDREPAEQRIRSVPASVLEAVEHHRFWQSFADRRRVFEHRAFVVF